ncbi:MAG: pseudouridine synthase [Pirellulaceae bacterium]
MPDSTGSRAPGGNKSSKAEDTDRLHKVLAAAGIGSRRKCEEMILEGRIEVDGDFVTQVGTSVNPATQDIRVDGQRIRPPKKRYFLLNKPPGVVSTNFDPSGRTRVVDLVPQDERVFTIGRLDRASEGLILLTNDGELTNHLAHPKFGVEKTYLVEVDGHPDPEAIKMMRAGVHFAEAFVKPDNVRLKRKNKRTSTLEIILSEGRNREIRRLLARVGHKVVRLRRISIGPLRLGEVPVGAYRELTSAEVTALRTASEEIRAAKPPRRSHPPKRSGGGGARSGGSYSQGGKSFGKQGARSGTGGGASGGKRTGSGTGSGTGARTKSTGQKSGGASSFGKKTAFKKGAAPRKGAGKSAIGRGRSQGTGKSQGSGKSFGTGKPAGGGKSSKGRRR